MDSESPSPSRSSSDGERSETESDEMSECSSIEQSTSQESHIHACLRSVVEQLNHHIQKEDKDEDEEENDEDDHVHGADYSDFPSSSYSSDSDYMAPYTYSPKAPAFDDDSYSSDSSDLLPFKGPAFDDDSYFSYFSDLPSPISPLPPHLKRLAAEGDDAGEGHYGNNDDNSGNLDYDYDEENKDCGYEDGEKSEVYVYSDDEDNNNGDGEGHQGRWDDSNFFDIGDGSGNYSYGRAYLDLLLHDLTNHPDTVHIVDGSYVQFVKRQFRSPEYLFRFYSNGNDLAEIYVDLPPTALPPESSVIDPRSRQDRARHGGDIGDSNNNSTVCPICHRSRSFDDYSGNAEERDDREGSGNQESQAPENQQSKKLQNQEMKQSTIDPEKQKTDEQEKHNSHGEEKVNVNAQEKQNPNGRDGNSKKT